jgi:hypothetical protein
MGELTPGERRALDIVQEGDPGRPEPQRVIAEHTNDPGLLPHFHAGQPKLDSSRDAVNFGWDAYEHSGPFERYQKVGGDHHYYYESDD